MSSNDHCGNWSHHTITVVHISNDRSRSKTEFYEPVDWCHNGLRDGEIDSTQNVVLSGPRELCCAMKNLFLVYDVCLPIKGTCVWQFLQVRWLENMILTAVHRTEMCVYTHSRQIVWVLRCLSVAQNGQSVQFCLLLFINVCVLHCSGFGIIQRTLFWLETFCVIGTTPHFLILHSITVCS